jgi:hypothetical protein
MLRFRGAVVLASLVAAGCVSVSPKVAKDARMEPGVAYVGGLFSKDTITGFGFALRDVATDREYLLPFEDKDFGLIAVAPGTYRVAYWTTWALTGERLTKKDVPASSPLGRTFKVSPGQVMLLGQLSADRELHVGSNTFSLASKRISGAALREQFKSRYAGFAGASVGCLSCDP